MRPGHWGKLFEGSAMLLRSWAELGMTLEVSVSLSNDCRNPFWGWSWSLDSRNPEGLVVI